MGLYAHALVIGLRHLWTGLFFFFQLIIFWVNKPMHKKFSWTVFMFTNIHILSLSSKNNYFLLEKLFKRKIFLCIHFHRVNVRVRDIVQFAEHEICSTFWCRTDRYDLPGLSRALEIIVQGKKALVEIIGLGVRITWNLISKSEKAFWAIIVTLPQGTP